MTYAREHLLPRLKHVKFEQTLAARGLPDGQRPVTAPWVGELLVTYAFDTEDALVMVTPALLAQAGISAADVAQVALENLRSQLPQPEYFVKDGCAVAVVGRHMEATLLLVDEPWRVMQPSFRGEIVTSVPHRDRLLIADSSQPRALRALQEATHEFFTEAKDGHALSRQLMARRAGQWQLFEVQ